MDALESLDVQSLAVPAQAYVSNFLGAPKQFYPLRDFKLFKRAPLTTFPSDLLVYKHLTRDNRDVILPSLRALKVGLRLYAKSSSFHEAREKGEEKREERRRGRMMPPCVWIAKDGKRRGRQGEEVKWGMGVMYGSLSVVTH